MITLLTRQQCQDLVNIYNINLGFVPLPNEQLYILFVNHIRIMWLSQEVIALAYMMIDDNNVQSFILI